MKYTFNDKEVSAALLEKATRDGTLPKGNYNVSWTLTGKVHNPKLEFHIERIDDTDKQEKQAGTR